MHLRSLKTISASALLLALLAFAAGAQTLLAAKAETPADPLSAPKRLIYEDDFTHGLEQWVVEQMPGGTVKAENGVMTITDKAGCTVWFKHKLSAPVVITYDAMLRADGRISDLNCFWMASDPARPDVSLLAPGHERTGKFSTYDSLLTYYVGQGGNRNSTTRFRRYAGTGDRPLLPGHEYTDAPHLLKAGKTYQITLVAANGTASYICNGEKLFSFDDPAPLTEGWFAIRILNNKTEIRNLKIYALEQ